MLWTFCIGFVLNWGHEYGKHRQMIKDGEESKVKSYRSVLVLPPMHHPPLSTMPLSYGMPVATRRQRLCTPGSPLRTNRCYPRKLQVLSRKATNYIFSRAHIAATVSLQSFVLLNVVLNVVLWWCGAILFGLCSGPRFGLRSTCPTKNSINLQAFQLVKVSSARDMGTLCIHLAVP